MSDINRLLAIEAIKQTKARYYRMMDTKDWAGFADVFAPDAELDMRGEDSSGLGLVSGNQQIADYVRAAVDAIETVHHGHMPEIELTSPTTATAIFAMEDMLRWPNGRTLHGYGHYHETYRLVDGRWLIQTSTLTRLRRDVVPGADD